MDTIEVEEKRCNHCGKSKTIDHFRTMRKGGGICTNCDYCRTRISRNVVNHYYRNKRSAVLQGGNIAASIEKLKLRIADLEKIQNNN